MMMNGILLTHQRTIAWFLATVMYLELTLTPVAVRASEAPYRQMTSYNTDVWANPFSQKVSKYPTLLANGSTKSVTQSSTATQISKHFEGLYTTGPTQPEMQAFSSVNNANMVDLFTGDFSYNIPLLDVGGYPVNLGYRSGISMDQEASWVGLGWNVNPGTITRNMRGLPDDFNGKSDSIKKVLSIKENKTTGVTVGADVELVGLPLSVGANAGVFNNNYKGWGLEYALNASINAGLGSMGTLTSGLSVTNNSQEGVTVAPTLSLQLASYNETTERGIASSFSTTLPYNSRSGLKGLQTSIGIRQFESDGKNQSGSHSSFISFASPGYTPSITIPFTSKQFSFTAKVGLEFAVIHPSLSVSGYVSRQRIDRKDTLLALPAYGYLHFQEGAQNRSSLLDFNREKELPYREKPAVPHIAVPSYTYDAFSITGEGTGGMFRAYRGDIGLVHDHFIRTKDESDRASIDIGEGNLVHAGIDINLTRAFTQNGPWINQNPLKNVINFRRSDSSFEAVYFRNPGEKPLNSKQFYESIGGDDVVTVNLFQPDNRGPGIQSTNYLTKYRNKRIVGRTLLTPQNAVKNQRDKRTQVISYLTAKEANIVGLSKFIENYTVNSFDFSQCSNGGTDNFEGRGTGLKAEYYDNIKFNSSPRVRMDSINYDWGKGVPRTPITNIPFYNPFPADQFSIRWVGRVKAPVTGQYIFQSFSDDGIRLWLNDSLLRNHNFWTDHAKEEKKDTVYLLAGEMYNIKVEYYENGGQSQIQLFWKYPGASSFVSIPRELLYPPAVDTFRVNAHLIKERRINTFRKENHISQVNVLNTDGRRYVYGIPVYNLKQKELTFSVDASGGKAETGLVKYAGTDNSAANTKGRDQYFSSEEIPAYAHSFLLTGILSADYVDITDNGISDDDIGDAVRFNYSKISGVKNPFRWRAPAAKDSATYNEGLKTDSRDDKGNYLYGEKELWYLHSIESKTMVATFTVEARMDLPALSENGSKSDGGAKRLKEIKLFSKADLLKHGSNARPIKTVHFEYSYELCPGINQPLNDSGKLTLKKVWFTYNGNAKGKQNPYIFQYNANNPRYNIKSYDRWGNFKNPSDNPGSTITNVLHNAEYPYALQDSLKASLNAGAWALDSILLPSGGGMKIQYESDDYGFVQHKRAMQMFRVIGFGTSSSMPSNPSQNLYKNTGDHLYLYVTVPSAVSNTTDVYQKYLQDVRKLFFRLSVRMPSDMHGQGSEYVSCYADLDQGNSYGVINATTIWLKLSGISLRGDGGGNFSPLAKAAIQFLRLNLPSKAYPGSEIGDDMGAVEAVKLLASVMDNVQESVSSFDKIARGRNWATLVDTSRSFVRLNSPQFKKMGGGHRVKRITIYDNWDKMTGRRAALYGQEYIYRTARIMGSSAVEISSGVASYEPAIGGEENPLREPIEYFEQIAPLAPVTLGYSEAPLGESFYPAAGIGYSKVRVRSINYKNIRSANGFEETQFYTAYDFPTYVDHTLIDDNTKKRYKPAIANFLRINAKHYLTLSQGFKVELNDMHGKLKSQASYPHSDPNNYVTYTEYIYRTENLSVDHKRLSNTVMVMMPDGSIDSSGLIGKDVELMVDMREQQSITNGYNVNVNSDMFTASPVPPFFLIPSFLNLAQRDENLYRSVATTKIIQRYGILDSVIHVDKGSKVSTKDILYDGETGNVLLTRTQNEFNDPVYNFNYPSHWAYDGMGMAYKNIDVVLNHITIRDGRITQGLGNVNSGFFSSGDEILVAGRQKAGVEVNCEVDTASFPSYTKIWVIDTSLIGNGQRAIYFIDREGKPYNGFDVSLKIIRSGRRNIHTSVGSVSSLQNPLVKDSIYRLVLNTNSKIIQASAGEFKQVWQTEDIKKKRTTITCVDSIPQDCSGGTSCTCHCLRQLFDYLIYSKRLFIDQTDNISVGALVQQAANAGYDIEVSDCALFQQNSSKPFYSLTTDSISNVYRAKIGNCIVSMLASDVVNLYSLTSDSCTGLPYVKYSTGSVLTSIPITKTFQSTTPVSITPVKAGTRKDTTFSAIIAFEGGSDLDSVIVDGTTIFLDRMRSYINFDSIELILPNSIIHSATLDLRAYPPGIFPGSAAHTIGDTLSVFVPNFTWNTSTAPGLFSVDSLVNRRLSAFSNNQNFSTINVKSHVERWVDPSNAMYSGLGFTIHPDADTLRQYFSFASSLYPTSTLRPKLTVNYTVVLPGTYRTAKLQVDSCRTCDTLIDNTCRSLVVDTTFNPYTTGVLGNWRANRSYTYFGRRAESDPSAATNIRVNGAFKDFAAYWSFSNGVLSAQPDTARWVWNSEITRFNRKGFEVENKDPLGRFNAGLYGYNLTMPVAVIQNSRFRESGYDGFEDYDFITRVCDTVCSTNRHLDFSAYKSKFDTSVSHSGKTSLKLSSLEQATVSVNVSSVMSDTTSAKLQTTTKLNCSNTVLDKIVAPASVLLPGFSPIAGKRMVISAWVREDQDCKCISYSDNAIVVAFTGGSSTSVTFSPTGSIIEGWQRYESVFDIPVDATSMTVSLQSTGDFNVHFDDLRIHPFNANMKSFVYNPTDLRLMAELDENNYTAFYEYDDDGTLVRVKKETQRGIKTIKETRSALLKQ